MAHGSGGASTSELIDEIFIKEFGTPDQKKELEDAAVVKGASRLAMTTDSFVVTPLEFPGGDIGRLAVCGTVNDLLMRGATPKYLTCGYVLEEGLDSKVLERIVHSMAETAKEAGVKIVAGDTKVVEGNGGLIINTAGVGFVPEELEISSVKIQPGDAVIVSGNLGDHHATILSQRMNINNNIKSDNAPLVDIVKNLIYPDGTNTDNVNPYDVHCLRDVTRGGLATVLKELAESSNVGITLQEDALPVSNEVKDFYGLLGLDPLYMGNEGKLVCFVPAAQAPTALEAIRNSAYGADATIIGCVSAENSGEVLVETSIGGLRRLDVLHGEGLPRIC
jgi:hydrogenase expression/formation protein HypE